MKAHRTDLMSLVFGLVFILVASGFLLKSYLTIELPEVGWFVAGGLILVGIITAIGAMLPDRRPKEALVPESDDEVTQP